MGANYYHRFAHCDCCGRYDERHIGKSLVMFRGYRPDPDWPDDFTGPVLASWQQWKEALSKEGEVWDEYGRQHDVQQFIADVESTDPVRRRRQYDWMQQHSAEYFLELDHDWLDADGFSFTGREFS